MRGGITTHHQIIIRSLRVAPFQPSNMPIPRITSKLPGSQSPNEPPSEMDRSGNSNHIDLLADVAAEQAARRRAGFCPQCGVVQTHTIVLWGRRRKPIQVCFSWGGNYFSFSLPGCIISCTRYRVAIIWSLSLYCLRGNGLGGNGPRCRLWQYDK